MARKVGQMIARGDRRWLIRVYLGRDHETKKRNYRALWQVRINASARAAGTTYSRFMEGLKAAKVALDRKVLADIAVRDEAAFGRLVDLAREALPSSPGAGVAAGAGITGETTGVKVAAAEA